MAQSSGKPSGKIAGIFLLALGVLCIMASFLIRSFMPAFVLLQTKAAFGVADRTGSACHTGYSITSTRSVPFEAGWM